MSDYSDQAELITGHTEFALRIGLYIHRICKNLSY